SEPTTPTPAVPAGPLPSAGGSFASNDALLSEKMGRRLRSTLRTQHDAVTQLAATIVLPEPDGGATVVALYEYSLFEVCVAKGGKTKEARRKCADEATTDGGEPMAALRACTGRGLVRARFGPPPASNPAYGGKLTVAATRPVAGGCTVEKIHAFRLHDVDGDRRPELEVDLVTTTPNMTFRDPERYDVRQRTIGWYREDLEPQFEGELGSWGLEGEVMESTEARRFALTDVDGDGGIDLELETWEIDPSDCTLKLDAWEASVRACSTDASESTKAVWRYDRGKDAWVEPA
ncbi:MAG: hypothetical protein KDK70_39860, partial [Myxococcales bacterium]|nr:hypothetical protein [Myxococcales bacterium]